LKKRLFGVLGLVLVLLLVGVPVLAVAQLSDTVVTEVCTDCPISIEWAVGETPGTQPSEGFTASPLEVDWELSKAVYVWLSLNCTSETVLGDLFIVFEVGGNVLAIVRTTPPTGWPSEVPYEDGFESGAYIYGPSGGFQLSAGTSYAEFTITPVAVGCHSLEVYVVQDAQASQEL
jgi:hypothetical protein